MLLLLYFLVRAGGDDLDVKKLFGDRFEYTFLPGNCSPFSKTFSHVLPFATCDPLLDLNVLLDTDELSLLLLLLLLL